VRGSGTVKDRMLAAGDADGLLKPEGHR
jgi:hypothetical protein